MAKIITAYNHKGGSGKSLLSVNLSGTLANMGYRVLHIDLDSQGNGSTRLGYYRHRINILNSFQNDYTPLPIFPFEHDKNLFVCPGSRELEREGYNMYCKGVSMDGKLKELLEPLQDKFHVIVIDTPPSGVSPFVDNALIASTHLLVPVDADGPNATENLDLVLQKYTEMITHNSQLELLGIVINRFEDDQSGKRVIEEVKKQLSGQEDFIYKTKIKEYKSFQAASWKMVPFIYVTRDDAHASKNFMDFTLETIKRMDLGKPGSIKLKPIETYQDQIQ